MTSASQITEITTLVHTALKRLEKLNETELAKQGQEWLDSLVAKRASLGTPIEKKAKRDELGESRSD